MPSSAPCNVLPVEGGAAGGKRNTSAPSLAPGEVLPVVLTEPRRCMTTAWCPYEPRDGRVRCSGVAETRSVTRASAPCPGEATLGATWAATASITAPSATSSAAGAGGAGAAASLVAAAAYAGASTDQRGGSCRAHCLAPLKVWLVNSRRGASVGKLAGSVSLRERSMAAASALASVASPFSRRAPSTPPRFAPLHCRSSRAAEGGSC